MSSFSFVCRSAAERRRLDDVRQRLRPVAPVIVALFVAAGLTALPTTGWLPVVPVAAATTTFGVMWLMTPRLKRPEYALVGTWLIGELTIGAAIAIGHGPHAYQIVAFALPLMMVAVIFPGRVMPWLIGLTLVIAGSFAVLADSSEIQHSPPTLFVPLAIILALGLTLSTVRDLDVDSRRNAVVDELTGLLNRSALIPRAAELRHQAAVTGASVAVIVADVDHFKSINDRHGHATGDAVLRQVAERLTRCIHAEESCYRYGGEEFVIVLAGADLRSAQQTAQRMREAVRASAIAGCPVTMSFGVAASDPGHSFDFSSVFERADLALYQAKHEGRDQVRASADDAPRAAPPLQAAARADDRGRSSLGTDSVARVDAPADPRRVSASRWLRRPIFANALERDHMLDLNSRLRVSFISCAIVTFAALVAAAPWYGWQILPAPVIGAVAYNVAQRRIERWRRPERALLLGWVIFAVSIFVGFSAARNSPIFALPLFVVITPGVSAIFPRRVVVALTALVILLMVVAAVVLNAAAVVANPSVLMHPIGLLVSVALIGSAVGRSAISHRSAAVVDSLTGMLNRMAMQTRIAEIAARRELTGDNVAVIIGDLDHFKRVNDVYGHVTGDEVLTAVGARLRVAVRAFESAYRIGGEEFVILLVGADVSAESAAALAERVRRAVSAEPMAGVQITMSLGVALLTPGERFSEQDILGLADAALYRAKASGRDRTVVQNPGGVLALAA